MDTAHESIEPKYPPGTPEYEAYSEALRIELRKFAKQEPPYDNLVF